MPNLPDIQDNLQDELHTCMKKTKKQLYHYPYIKHLFSLKQDLTSPPPTTFTNKCVMTSVNALLLLDRTADIV